MERETGIEPATNSLEGCDSTTELLPPSRRSLRFPPHCPITFLPSRATSRAPPIFTSRRSNLHTRAAAQRKVGGEGRVRTSVARRRQVYSLLRLTALPPPRNTSRAASGHDCFGSQHLYPLRPWAVALKPAHVIGVRVSDVSLKGVVTVHGAGGGIRTPDLLITNQLLYRPELRQPDKEQIIALPVPAEQLDGLSRQIWRGSRDRPGLPQPTPTASII